MTDVCEHGCPETIGVEVRGVYDGVLYWTCNNGHRWHRWPEGYHLHDRAEPFVKGGDGD